MEECTPALTSSVVSLIAYFRPKNEITQLAGLIAEVLLHL